MFTVFAIGFGIAAMFATGGAALFFAAGAFGLSTYDAMKQTEQYMVDKPASNIAEDKDGGFNAPPGWGWLVVAWIGVGLDATQVVSAVGKVAKTGKVIEGAEELAKAETAAKMGMTREALLAKLRQVAGEVDAAATLTEGTRATVAQRLGILVDVDPKLGGDVRILYEVDKTTGRAIVQSLSAGPQAKLVEVLAHENLVKLMRRYEGVTGRLREIWEKLLAVVGKSPKEANPFPAGAKAYESWNELQKMPELVEATKLKYADGVGKANESALAKDLDILEAEARRHQKIVDEMVLEAGEGFVAKTGDSTRAALAAKYPLPPDCKTAEEMLAKGYYYRQGASGNYEIARTSKSVGQQLWVEFDATGKIPVRLVPAVEKLEAKIPDAAQLTRLRAIVTDDATLGKLYDSVLDANRLEKLLKDVGDGGKLKKLLGDIGKAEDLEKLLKNMTVGELEKFMTELGDVSKMKELAEKYGGDVLKHYGGKFFKDFTGVDSDTLTHLANFEGIDKKVGIKGCHDDALFRAELAKPPDGVKSPPAGVGRGEIISEVPHPSDPRVKKIEYGFWQQDGKGNLISLLTRKAASYTKTTIVGLAGDTATWQAQAMQAVEDAIKAMKFPVKDASFSGVAKNGMKWTGWYRNGKIQTVFVDF